MQLSENGAMALKAVAKAPKATIFQIRITLLGTKPEVWRRIEVNGKTTLVKLHHIIQRAMGWDDYHLHEFRIRGQRYGAPERKALGLPESPLHDESGLRLEELGGDAVRFSYIYDFGDTWEHEVQIEGVVPPEPGVRYPRCRAGERACPPEDCGGIWGYAELLAALRDPKHPRHKGYREWVGKEFEAERFDLEAVNHSLLRLRG
ncbi:MAG: plasmid pRiA4b ORF-3 family protein [Rhodocyclaceae bacterium]|nr:plasmid pRiA4b ORF-3 family protein [Rhodocyclaceae bacterium]